MKYAIIFGFWLANFMALLSANNLPFEIVKTPSSTNSLASNLFSFGDSFALSWIERDSKSTARLHMASWNKSGFGEKYLITASNKMFTNWADIPSVIEAPSGDLYAHWLERISSKNYAYGVQIARSTNHGKNWKPVGWLHNDTSATEHGFVSLIPEGLNVRAFWLDGRMMTTPTGKMMLRTAVIDEDQIKNERVLDKDVCTCCPTSAVQLPNGPVVVYRDRSSQEIRDISFILRSDDKWSKPSTLQSDNWLMPGCPVNGASIAARKDLVAVSRFTVIHNKSQVILRLIKNKNMKSGKDIILDKNAPIGRCVTVCSKDSIFTAWIGLHKKQTVLRLAEVSPVGEIIRHSTLTTINANRSSGMPRAIISRGYLWLSWTDSNIIRFGRLKIDG